MTPSLELASLYLTMQVRESLSNGLHVGAQVHQHTDRSVCACTLTIITITMHALAFLLSILYMLRRSDTTMHAQQKGHVVSDLLYR